MPFHNSSLIIYFIRRIGKCRALFWDHWTLLGVPLLILCKLKKKNQFLSFLPNRAGEATSKETGSLSLYTTEVASAAFQRFCTVGTN